MEEILKRETDPGKSQLEFALPLKVTPSLDEYLHAALSWVK